LEITVRKYFPNEIFFCGNIISNSFFRELGENNFFVNQMLEKMLPAEIRAIK
jgi:hypothetical protein